MVRVRYVGSREWVLTTGLNRKEYFFNKDNNFTVVVENEMEATKLLSSAIHRFMILPEEMKPEEVKIPDTPQEQEKRQVSVEKPIKQKEKKHEQSHRRGTKRNK